DFDPHKPYVDEITFECSCGGMMRRTPEVIDVWFDSGSMPYAQFHYPFENKEKFERCYPVDYISEGVDQTRGWFYTLHAINTFLFGEKAFRNEVSRLSTTWRRFEHVVAFRFGRCLVFGFDLFFERVLGRRFGDVVFLGQGVGVDGPPRALGNGRRRPRIR